MQKRLALTVWILLLFVYCLPGISVGQICRKLEISEHTYYRWRKEYGGLKLDQAKRLKLLELENLRLKKLVADQALDNSILREAAKGNF